MRKLGKFDCARAAISLLLGAMFVIAAVGAYSFWLPGGFQASNLIELSFWSNLLAGILLLADGGYALARKKHLPNWLFFDATILLLIVCGMILAFGGNLAHGFQFVHIVDPILMMIFWLIFINHSRDKIAQTVLSAAVAPLCYLLVVEIFAHGYYPIIDPRENGAAAVALLLAAIVAVVIILAFGLLYLNRWRWRIFSAQSKLSKGGK